MDLENIKNVIQMLGISFPKDLASTEEQEEQILTDILVEELTKYQDINIARDVALFPTEEDLWAD